MRKTILLSIFILAAVVSKASSEITVSPNKNERGNKEKKSNHVKKDRSNNFLPMCYTFGYERQCIDPGFCIEYTLCGDGSNFAAIWQAHLEVDNYLHSIDCEVLIPD